MIPVRRTRIYFPWRNFLRMFFRLCMIGLIVASCTQSLTWLGNTTVKKPHSHRQKDYYYNDYSSTRRSSTRYNEYQQPIEEDEYEYKY